MGTIDATSSIRRIESTSIAINHIKEGRDGIMSGENGQSEVGHSLTMEKRRWLKRHFRGAFSLIELLVVVGIISILAAMLLPALKSAMDVARSTVCLNNLKQSGTGLIFYAADYDDWVISGGLQPGLVRPDNVTLGRMLMANGYIPNIIKSTNTASYTSTVPFPNSFSCPSQPPPASYTFGGKVYPADGCIATTATTYGLRAIPNWKSYPGEQLAFSKGDQASTDRWIPKFSTIYVKAPYMVDTTCEYADGAGKAYAVKGQSYVWFLFGTGMTWESGFHLRHNTSGNAWFADGHAVGMKASDVMDIKQPDSGLASGFSNNPLGYTY